jgi:hypothetical protein
MWLVVGVPVLIAAFLLSSETLALVPAGVHPARAGGRAPSCANGSAGCCVQALDLVEMLGFEPRRCPSGALTFGDPVSKGASDLLGRPRAIARHRAVLAGAPGSVALCTDIVVGPEVEVARSSTHGPSREQRLDVLLEADRSAVADT